MMSKQGYWDICNEAHDKLIRIQGRRMFVSWDGGHTLLHSVTFTSNEKAANFAQMLIDILICTKVKVN